jgi:hypothetical protein
VCLNVNQEALFILSYIMMLVGDSACIHSLINNFAFSLSLDMLVQCYAFVDGIEQAFLKIALLKVCQNLNSL